MIYSDLYSSHHHLHSDLYSSHHHLQSPSSSVTIIFIVIYIQVTIFTVIYIQSPSSPPAQSTTPSPPSVVFQISELATTPPLSFPKSLNLPPPPLCRFPNLWTCHHPPSPEMPARHDFVSNQSQSSPPAVHKCIWSYCAMTLIILRYDSAVHKCIWSYCAMTLIILCYDSAVHKCIWSYCAMTLIMLCYDTAVHKCIWSHCDTALWLCSSQMYLIILCYDSDHTVL